MSIGMQITATGGTADQRELVTNVMARGLVEHGFSNVALVNTVGEPMVGSHIPSLMDEIRSVNPAFMQTPIQIWSVDTVDPLEIPEVEIGEPQDRTNGMAIATSSTVLGERMTSISMYEPETVNRPALTVSSFQQSMGSSHDNTDALEGGSPKPMESAA